MSSWIKGIIPLVCLLAAYFAGKYIGIHQVRDSIVNSVDTLVVHDTVVYDRPVEKEVRVLKPVYITVRDTVICRDSFFIPVPIEQKVYADSTYRAVVSGFRASLDSISVYNTTKYITKTQTVEVKKFRKFTYGVQLGIGGTYGLVNKRWDVGPYLGVGIGYNF